MAFLNNIRFFVLVLALAGCTSLSCQESSLFSGIDPSEEVYYKKFIEGNNRVAFDLYHSLRRGSGNLCFSPYSLVTGLGMPAIGTYGKTKEALERFLHFSFPLFLFSADLKGDGLQGYPGFVFINSLWVDSSISLLPSFTHALQLNFKEPPHRIDFGGVQSNALATINRFAADKTDGKIKQSLTSSLINQKTKLFLMTGFYGQGEWTFPFDFSRTKRLPFAVSSSRTALAEMMLGRGSFLVAEGLQCSVIALPIASNGKPFQLFLVIMMPKKELSLTDFEAHFTFDVWAKLKATFETKEAEVLLPRFYVEGSFVMDSSLKGLGLPSLFSESGDFSKMTEQKGIALSHVIHRCAMGVGEGGVYISPAQRSSKPIQYTEKEVSKSFSADRPFVFMLWDQKSDAILSFGRIVYP